MKNEVKTRVWGGLETLAFCGIYLAASYIARFLLYLFFAVYYAISNYTNHEVFHADKFVNEINAAIAGCRTELIMIADILIVLLCAIVIFARGAKFKKYMALEKRGVLQITGGVIAGAAIWYVMVYVISSALAGSSALNDYGEHIGQLNSGSPMLVFILTVLVAPIAEELLFRGALFNSLTSVANKPMAVLLTAVLFAVVHVDPVQMSYAFVLGIMLAFIRSETEMIVPCIAMHIAFNFMNYLGLGYIMPLWVAMIICCVGYALALCKKVW